VRHASYAATMPVQRPEQWWRDAVFYQIYPRSFADANGDGIGDLEGIRSKLDHLVWLGVDALWLSPIYRSPQRDFGYDVADHCAVDPIFGDLADFDRLLADAHDRGLRVILDWVPNHVSDAHPWFKDALTGPDAAHRDWFWWREGKADGAAPNNWVAAFPPETRAWTRDPATGQWYLHLFLPSQPDLDWDNPAVEAAMHDVLRFWLDRGVDGFRADAFHCVAKPPGLPDTPDDLAGIPHCVLNDEPAIHPRLRGVRKVLEEYGPERMMIGEIYLLDTKRVAAYYGTPEEPELHLSFNVPVVHTRWDAAAFGRRVDEIDANLRPRDAWPVWALSSHDEVRHRTRFGGSERCVRAAAVLTLTQRGTPFLYQGEELGLAQADISPEVALDPGGRDGCRAPIPWNADPGHGWPAGSDVAPWLPLAPEATTRNAATQQRDTASTLTFYRELLALRRATPALHEGEQAALDAPAGVLAWRRTHGNGDRVVAINFTEAPVPLPALDGAWVVELCSDEALGETDNAAGAGPSPTIGGNQALVLRPA
jgi:alpha-glucosidase